MQLKIIDTNDMEQNIYIYFCEETRDGIIIDAGDSFGEICEIVARGNINVKAILLTHGHFDHIICVNELREHFNVPVYAHKDEKELLQSPDLNRACLRGLKTSATPDKFFNDNDIFKFAGTELKVIHTPGHTAGGVCYYDEKNAVLFSGDTLFCETIGRTDLPTSNHGALLKSIADKLFTLPEGVKVFPGHGEGTTIKHEKQNNKRI
jgi:glyoxylase-like metal-dependent hydrolase (beta-lactamase superfamily II)